VAKDKERLANQISSEIKLLQKQVLDLSELVVPNERWGYFRKKILDITNNARRNIESKLIRDYQVKYDPTDICEDVVEVRQRKISNFNKLVDKEGKENGK